MARAPANILRLVDQAAAEAGIPRPLFRSLVRHESGFNPRAVSPAGAMGLAQLMPSTAKALGVRDPFDPAQNVRAGARYLRSLIDRFGSVPLALAAYNAGPNAVAKHGGIPPYPETQAYVRNVLRDAGGEADRALPGPVAAQSPPPAPAPTVARVRPGGVTVLDQAGRIAPVIPGGVVNLGKMRQQEVARPAPYRGTKRNPAVDVDVPRHVALTERAAQVVKLAHRYLGTPYKWGGASPRTGFDCSGFVQWLYASVGVKLPRTSWQQMKVGRSVPRDQLQPGDLLFFGSGEHEGLYIGNGLFIHASRTGDVVKISSLADPWYRRRLLMARRVLPGQAVAEVAA